jgi:hypothetical protein
MSVVELSPQSTRSLWSGVIGCVLGGKAYPVECSTPEELRALLKKLG